MYDNQVWNLVDLVHGQKTIGCKWIFKKKTDMDGKVHTFKARLVVKGFIVTSRLPGIIFNQFAFILSKKLDELEAPTRHVEG